MSNTTRRLPLADVIAKQVAEAIKAELRTELTTLIENKFAELQVQEPDTPDYEQIVCDNCGEPECQCDINECGHCGERFGGEMACNCQERSSTIVKPCGHPIIKMKDGSFALCNCAVPLPADDNIYDEDLANQIHYHRLTQCFTGDFTRNYPTDIDFVESYQQSLFGLGEESQFNKAFNDARERFQAYNAKVDDPSHSHNEQAQHSYFHMLKNKIINMSGIKEKIENAISKLQRAEIYIHGRDAVLFKEGIKELRELL
ncbi:hypothetical protein BNJ_00389 [Kaumoebavirus]|uniref:hypothetical protein n=1 Tax=Kaumoebavirus TaxID=1859492 RepID=UPI0009C24E30|nr:hypothetical protein BNJ_00389 [Kaumoebavirus]ARA72208.1 hypothetical protein BNJ_00389 [Kaumoebavirus]